MNISLNIKKKHKRWTSGEWFVFIGAMLGLAFLIVFSYVPMAGTILAFKDGDYELSIMDALLNSDFTLDNFKYLFDDDSFPKVLINTISLNALSLLFTFPAPIIFALLLNSVSKRFRNKIQIATNLPHFISWTVFGGIILALTNMSTGLVNPILEFLGLSNPEDPINLQRADYFWGTMIVSSIIKNFGWNSIIYLAAMSAISPELYEAATLDGANRFQKVWYITLPLIASTITITLLMSIGHLLGNSFEQFYVFQNGVNLSKSEVLSTYIFKEGISNGRYSYAAAISLFDSVVSFILLEVANFISKKTTGRGLY